ncbi:hypothetical protein R1sor_006155 [Riccia sorocarpa]|uniref:non-specific serine/threonine protein kinase n=1 Tax=Riccia sorocarpa TaxID=122646 RepID=A0ABD3HQ89_9MARC
MWRLKQFIPREQVGLEGKTVDVGALKLQVRSTIAQEKQLLLIIRDICSAVYAMHCQSTPIAHRDLKVENVLMGADGAWKLCDFGSTSTNHKRFEKPDEMGLEEDIIRKHTTPAYRAPEMWDLFAREVISEKVDIWALGCLLYRIAYFKSAFDGESKLQILNGNYRIPDAPKYSNVVTDLIRTMLAADPSARPYAMQVRRQVNEALQTISEDLIQINPRLRQRRVSKRRRAQNTALTNPYDSVKAKGEQVCCEFELCQQCQYSRVLREQAVSVSVKIFCFSGAFENGQSHPSLTVCVLVSQSRERQNGSIWELQEGLTPGGNGSKSQRIAQTAPVSPESGNWQAFSDSPSRPGGPSPSFEGRRRPVHQHVRSASMSGDGWSYEQVHDGPTHSGASQSQTQPTGIFGNVSTFTGGTSNNSV